MFNQVFRVGGALVSTGLNRIERDGRTVHLRPKSMEVLAFLAQRAGQVTPRDELLSLVWPGLNVAEEGLTQCIAEIREALGDNVRRPAYVETVPKRGYCLIAAVEVVADRQPAVAPSRPGLLVLPFEDLSPGGDHGHYADGLTEEIISAVSQLQWLRVIARDLLKWGPFATRLVNGTAHKGGTNVEAGGQWRSWRVPAIPARGFSLRRPVLSCGLASRCPQNARGRRWYPRAARWRRGRRVPAGPGPGRRAGRTARGRPGRRPAVGPRS